MKTINLLNQRLLRFKMGNSNKPIYYHRVPEQDRSTILSEFIRKYSNNSVKYVRVNKLNNNYINGVRITGAYVIQDKIEICFEKESEVIDFISKLNRPFVINHYQDFDDSYCYSFVYGLPTNDHKKDFKI